MYLPRNRPVEIAALAILFCLFCLIASEAVAQDVQPKSADRVSGVVVNSVNHEPIARALVVSNDERFAALTDINGRFEFVFAEASAGNDAASGPGRPVTSGNVNAGYRPYALTARKPGFLSRQNDQGVILSSMPNGKEVEIALLPEALIVGHIALPTSEPSDRIEVELYQRQVRNGRAHWVSAGVQTTRSDGEFRFAELAAGTYKLLTHELLDEDPKTATPGGQVYAYAPVYYPNANGFASAGTIELTPAKIVHANLSLVRQPYFPVTVPVANVLPGMGLDVKVSMQGRNGPGYALGYDPEKQMIVGSLPNGSFRLEAAAFGPQGMLSGVTSITVQGQVGGMVLPLTASAPIEVHVKEEFTGPDHGGEMIMGSPNGSFKVRGARRYLNLQLEAVEDFGIQPGASLRTPSGSQDDSMVVDHVVPGRYWVQFYPLRGYVASATSGGVDLLHKPLVVPAAGLAAPIEVTLRDDGAELEISMDDAGSSLGTVTPTAAKGRGENANPVATPTARVYLIPAPDSPGRFTEASAFGGGKLTIASLPPGTYLLLAFRNAQPDLEYENPEVMQAYDGKGQVVRLAAGQHEKVQLQWVSSSE